MNTETDMRFELLRALSAFAVVWLHVSGAFLLMDGRVDSFDWWSANVADSLSRWCVPVFVMITGGLSYLALQRMDVTCFYKRRFRRLIPITVLWTIIYLVFRSYFEAKMGAGEIIRRLVSGQPYIHLWYLYMLAGLLLVAPFLAKFASACDGRMLKLSIFVICLVSSLDVTVGEVRSVYYGTFFSMVPYYAGYFLLGIYAYKNVGSLSSRVLIAIFLFSSSMVAIGAYCLYPFLGVKGVNLMYSYQNPLVVMMSYSVFCLMFSGSSVQGIFDRLYVRNSVASVARLSLGVYLIHPIWLSLVKSAGLLESGGSVFVAIASITIGIYVVSLLSTYVLSNLRITKWSVI